MLQTYSVDFNTFRYSKHSCAGPEYYQFTTQTWSSLCLQNDSLVKKKKKKHNSIANALEF